MGLHRSFYSRGQQQGRCSAGWTGPESDRQLQWHYVSVSLSAGAALERGANLGLSHVTTGRDYVATPVGGERRQRSTNMQLIRGRPGRTLGRRPHSVPLSFGLAAVGGGPLEGGVGSPRSFPTTRMVKSPWRYIDLGLDCAVSPGTQASELITPAHTAEKLAPRCQMSVCISCSST